MDGAMSPRAKTAIRFAIVFAAAAVLMCLARAWQDTFADPVVRRTQVALAGYPQGEPPIRILLMSDIHPAAPDMTAARVHRIVAQANALHPDMVVIAGDMVSDRPFSTRHYTIDESIALLGGLRARLGVYAVLGNHDEWADEGAIARALAHSGVQLLRNRAVSAGPLALGGVDYVSHENRAMRRTLAEMAALGGPQVLLSHSPYAFPELPAGPLLMLSGHTHCGQIAYPWGGTPAPDISGNRNRYLCGVVRENGKTLIMTAGLGTSVIPVRFLAPPDVWLVTVGPPTKTAAGSPRRP